MSAISTEASIRLRILNFPLIIGVVYIHAYSASIEHAGMSLGPMQLDVLTDFIRTLISQGLARVAVPMFFLISGYFFFLDFPWSWRGYKDKLIMRAKTLLLPYLFWSVLVVATRYLGQSIPLVKAYFTGDVELLADTSGAGLIDAVLGCTRAPEAYHFWFIRDLMLLMVLSPLIYLLLRYLAWPFLGGVFIMWISVNWPIYTPEAVGVLFFSLGGYLAMKGKSLFIFDRYAVLSGALYIPLLIVDVISYNASYNHYLHRSGIVIGLIAVLSLSKCAMADDRLKNILLRLGGSSFFVYAAHEPLLGIARTLAFQFLPLDLPGVMLLTYLIVPLAAVVVLVAVHAFLRAYIPEVLRVVTGGR